MKALYNSLIVEEVKEEVVDGLYIPDTNTQKPKKGTVVAIGEGIVNTATGVLIPLDTKIGDTVLYPHFVGQKFEVDGKELTHMKETEILVIL